ncbi:MAG: hypothetical protein ACRYFX_10415 [Janthinobacterium lividum]
MNQSFNFTRFGRLLRKHTTEHLLSYLLQTAALFGGLALLMGGLSYLMSAPLSDGAQTVLFIFTLLGGGFLFASAAFREYGAGRQAATALTLPASQFEKYLVAWLYSLPVFLMVFTAAFYAADWLVMQINALRGPVPPLINIFEDNKGWGVLILALLLHAVAFWGSIYFKKLQLVKTGCVALGAFVVLLLVNYQLVRVLLGTKIQLALPFGAVMLPSGPPLHLPTAHLPWQALVELVLAALLWAAAYARLTEKQL